jgi:hypothetical protein
MSRKEAGTVSTTLPGQVTVRLHRLTMVAEDGGVMVGRPETGSYALFPSEGAELLRRLEAGAPIADGVRWYEHASGSALDVEDFLAAIEDLGFVRGENEDEAPAAPVRWRRLGIVVFSWPALAAYGAVIAAAIVAMIRDPSLRPSYRNLFFTDHPSLIPVVLTSVGISFVVVHEWCHMLAGRRLGLPSQLRIGRRFYYLIAETRLDALLSVPRRQRYLPFLAGMLSDTVILAGFTLLAVALRGTGVVAWAPKLCLALAFTNVLRLIWQSLFYLQTDLYYVVATAARCTHLQAAARFHIAALGRALARRPARLPSPDWSDRDLAAGRWYAPLLLAGYVFSAASLIWAGIPTTVRLWSAAVHRLRPGSTPADIADAVILMAFMATELGLLLFVLVRDLRARRRTASRQGATS